MAPYILAITLTVVFLLANAERNWFTAFVSPLVLVYAVFAMFLSISQKVLS